MSSSASAANSWSAPSTVIAPSAAAPAAPLDATAPHVMADGSGNLTAIWAGDQTGTAGVYSATKPVGGVWSPPQLRSKPGVAVSGLALAENAAGRAVAGWIESPSETDPRRTIRVDTKAPNGTWSGSTTVAPGVAAGSYEDTTSFELGIDGSGLGVSVWQRDIVVAGTSVVSGSELRSAFGAGAGWNPASAIASRATDLSLGVDAAGNATLLFVGDGVDHVMASYKPVATSGVPTWSAPVALDPWKTPSEDEPSPGAHGPEVAVNAAGDTVAVWARDSGAGQVLESASRPAGGAWSAPVTVQKTDEDAGIDSVRVGIDSAKNATVIWNRLGKQLSGLEVRLTSEIVATSATVGGAWSAPARISDLVSFVPDFSENAPPPPLYSDPILAVGPSGATAALWRAGFGSAGSLLSAVRTPGGAWQTSAKVSGLASTPFSSDYVDISAVIDPTGLATAIWPDGRKLTGATVNLAAAVVDPPIKEQPQGDTTQPPTTQDPPPGPAPTPAPAGPVTMPKPVVPTPKTPTKLVILANLVPSKVGKCPTKAVALIEGVRTSVKMKKARLSNKKIVCRVSVTLVPKKLPKAGTAAKIVISAKGVKSKAVSVLPSV